MATLLPPNATKEEIALDLTVGDRIDAIPVKIDTLWNPWTCPIEFLPWLAWTVSVDVWDHTWSEQIKRQVVATSIQVHRVKGTPGALQDALDALDLNATAIEWFKYGGSRFKFRIDVELETRGLTDQERKTIEAVALSAKNLRSKLDELRIYLTSRSIGPFMACATVYGSVLTVFPLDVSEIVTEGNPMPIVAAGTFFVNSVTIDSGN
ncbi:phage tail protein I [Kiloniella litopenaei]|uniref:phage tail protein I n=1 Tax=Kiloniella litopenaei TaxID=1549748 RepID=UPI003BA8A3E4